MVVVPPSIANDRQGRLRLYVCERLGYVLPRIEYLTGSGQVECTIDARQFTDAGNGLHVPKRTRVDYVDLSASPPHVVGRSEYRVVRWSRVNEPIDDEILSITVPAGTRIRDSRPDRPPVVFRLDNDQPLANLQAVTRPAIGKSTSWPSLRTICLAINLLLLFLLVVHLAVARR